MNLGGIGSIELIIGFVIWLAIVAYLLSLASRLVKAVERIAERMGEHSRRS
jgi:heme exporter protein D